MSRLALGLMAAAFLCGPAHGDDEGVVLVRVAPGLAGERAGLRPGDRVLRWRQGPIDGVVGSPFDLAELEAERGPRGPVQVSLQRGGESIEVALFPDDWGVDARPALPPETAAAFDAALELAQAGHEEEAAAGLRDVADGLQGSFDRAAWAWLEVARAEARGRRFDAAEAALRNALPSEPGAAPTSRDALLWTALGDVLEQAVRSEAALNAFREARAIRVRIDPEGVATAVAAAQPARLLRALGKSLTEARQELEAADARLQQAAPRSLARVTVLRSLGWTIESRVASGEAFRQALALAEELAPDGLEVARALHGLAQTIDEPERRAQMRRRAVDILERLQPDTTELVAAYSVLGGTLREQGDFATGMEWNDRAVALAERLAPGTEWHAMTLYNTAVMHQAAGDLARAETLLRRTLAIAEKVLPPGERHALVQYAIGLLLMDRGEDAEANRMLQRALGNLGLSGRGRYASLRGYCLKSLGVLALRGGEVEEAQRQLDEALAVFKTVALPMEIGNVYRELGKLNVERGRLEEAAAAYEQGFIALASHPRTVGMVGLLESAGDLALLRGDLDDAARHHSVALEVAKEVAPGSALEALAAHALGTIARRRGQLAEAIELYRRAIDALESQSANLGGSAEARTSYRAQFQRFYVDLEEVLLELGRDQAAFEVLERSRARELLRLLAGRDLDLGGLPETLVHERRRTDAEHDRILKRLSGTLDDAARAEALRQLADARRRQADVRARIRDAAPRAAALRDPDPLDLAGVRRAVDPGTLLLSYRLGPEKSRVYAVGPEPGDFAVLAIDLGEPAIREQVERFRDLIERRRGSLRRRELDEQAARLGRVLLGPAAARLARAERVLVVPDGVLHLLPFAALRDPSSPRRYVVESLPLHVVSSVTLYARITRPREDGGGATAVVGFGDPVQPASAEAASGTALTRALGTGLKLSPIPASRGELAALKKHFPQSAAIFIGPDATEERASSVARDTRVVHFATHGFVDEAFPLESGLVLSIPADGDKGKANGLLQAWEIFERVRLDADLVTLSACQTALGKEVAGEGLLGLTWAFQYAGARSVLASLWEVNDDSTAELMRRFYGHLKAGQPKAEALRRAQVELLRQPATSAPYLWAAFSLVGDWR